MKFNQDVINKILSKPERLIGMLSADEWGYCPKEFDLPNLGCGKGKGGDCEKCWKEVLTKEDVIPDNDYPRLKVIALSSNLSSSILKLEFLEKDDILSNSSNKLILVMEIEGICLFTLNQIIYWNQKDNALLGFLSEDVKSPYVNKIIKIIKSDIYIKG